jgi:hypothetical protein
MRQVEAVTLYRNGSSIGTVDGTGHGMYRFDTTLGATPRLVLGNGVVAYTYDTTNGLVEITDGDFPSSFTKGWAYLNGTLYVMTQTAHIQGSDINDPHSWDPLSSIQAQIEADPPVALTKQLVYVVALKEWSTEFFYDAGNATGSPLAFVQGAKINFGCINQETVQLIGGAIYMACWSRNSGLQVGVIRQPGTLDIISTKPVERLLQNADYSAVFSWYLALDGHTWYGLTLANDNITLAYDIDEQMWSQWTDVSGNYFPICSATYTTTGVPVLQHATNGRLYLASSEYTSDDGAAIPIDVYTPNWDGGAQGRSKHLSGMYFAVDRVEGELEVYSNDKDYDPGAWVGPRAVDLSLPTPTLMDCGSFNRRAHRFHYEGDTRFRLKAVELQLQLGSMPLSEV